MMENFNFPSKNVCFPSKNRYFLTITLPLPW